MSGHGALDLLSVYGDDELSEDDTVPGPKVSTKRTHKSDSDDEDTFKCIKPRLPLPELFTSSKTSATQDNQVEHNGRVRSFAHERGNWATYVYIPFAVHGGLKDLMEKIKCQATTLELNQVDHYHISLTKTLVLKYHWIESFTTTISEKLKGIKRFVVMFDTLQVYCNEERTRTFIGLQIKTGYDSLLNVTKVLDKCLLEFQLDTFYKDPSFHMSILWCLGDKVNELQSILPTLNEHFRDIYENYADSGSWYINVDSILCKTGNKHFAFSL